MFYQHAAFRKSFSCRFGHFDYHASALFYSKSGILGHSLIKHDGGFFTLLFPFGNNHADECFDDIYERQ